VSQFRPARSRVPVSTLALIGLLLVTASWGSTFFMLRGVVSRVPAADFLAVRFVLAAGVVWLVLRVVAPRAIRSLSRADRRRAVVLGIVYGAAQLLQTVGLETTSASVSGFITGLYVVLTPVLAAVLLRAELGLRVWAAVAVATAGLALLSLQGLALGGGELLTLAGALFYALHVVGLGVWSRSETALGMTAVQLMAISAVCSIGAVPGGLTLPVQPSDWSVLVYMALVAGALALLVQTWAQAQLSATRAAVLMTMEPVWAATFAALFGGERLGIRALAGGGLVLTAMYLIELNRDPEADGEGQSAGLVTPADRVAGTGCDGRLGARRADRGGRLGRSMRRRGERGTGRLMRPLCAADGADRAIGGRMTRRG
jgi:drug/metabolite transporter (DMT)-like permease